MDVPEVEQVGVVGKLVKTIETGGPQARKTMRKVEMGERKIGKLVKKNETRRSWKIGR